jgi:tripartite-type tricarboxylate transporter receptor subunit TctC
MVETARTSDMGRATKGVEMARISRRGAALALLAGVGLMTTAASASAADFYAGKQIILICGGAPGGGYDLMARLMSRHLSKYIPGNPTIVVQNMPAAGSLTAMNLLANTLPRDGTTIGLVQRGMLLMKLTNPAAVQFDLTKINWLGSLNSETAVTLAWSTSDVKTTQDLFEKQLIVGGQTGVDPGLTPLIYNDLIGTKFKIVNGYNGTTEIGLAMERGEVQGIGDWSWSSLNVQHPEWLSEKKVRILLQGALQSDPELKDVPNVLDFAKGDIERKALELYLTQKTIARPVLAPPGIPADRLAILRKAFASLATDKDFLADAQRTKLDVKLIDSDGVDKVIKLITAASPEVTQRYIKAATP